MSAPPASISPSISSSTCSGSSASCSVGRQHQRDAAGPLHGLDVVERQQRRLLVPDAPAGALERGADADHGPSHPPHHRINARDERQLDPPSGIQSRPGTREESNERAGHRARDGQRARRRRRRDDRAEPARGAQRLERAVRRRPARGAAQAGADEAVRARRDHRRRARLLLGRRPEGLSGGETDPEGRPTSTRR